jgi:hypothetical protein
LADAEGGEDKSGDRVEERIKWAFHRQLNINTFYPDAGRGLGGFRLAEGEIMKIYRQDFVLLCVI